MIRVLSAILLTSLISVGATAPAAEIPWRTKQIKHIAENKKLPEFLRDFAMGHGITTVISPQVDGVVNGKFDLKPQELLDLLATSKGLIYYFDGNILYIYSSNEAQSEMLRLSSADVSRLKMTLKQMRIADARYPLSFDATENTVLVSGPKRYVELVQDAARIVDENQSRRGSTEVRVFQLKYAWAQDYRLDQFGHNTTVPGVATTLRTLFTAPIGGKLMPAKLTPSKRAGSALAKVKGSDTPVRVPNKLELPGAQDAAAEPSAEALPQIGADSRMNAVLVRDVPERMPYYAQLIRQLDVQPGLVEIEAQIMDITSDDLESLGVDWHLNRGKMDFQIRGGTTPPLNFNGALGDAASGAIIPGATSPTGGLFTAVSGDLSRYLLARVSALATEGKARFVANPKVMTLDNVEALLENVNTVHVPVQGVQAVDLFDVSAGTSLRVTPLIVQEGELRRFKLAVQIDDGNFIGAPTPGNPVPQLRRSSIGTQAFINEGESLLIAGYTIEGESEREVGVPGLSKIPALGRLFKHTEKTHSRTERLFMLTPRLIQNTPRTASLAPPAVSEAPGQPQRQDAPAAQAATPASTAPQFRILE
jgi:type III secretion protein C